MHSSRLIQLISSGRRTHERRQPPATDSGSAYSGLHLYEEIVLGFPLPLRERDRVRGKGAATSLLIQTKNALRSSFSCRIGRPSTWRACRETGVSGKICCNLRSLTEGEARITR